MPPAGAPSGGSKRADEGIFGGVVEDLHPGGGGAVSSPTDGVPATGATTAAQTGTAIIGLYDNSIDGTANNNDIAPGSSTPRFGLIRVFDREQIDSSRPALPQDPGRRYTLEKESGNGRPWGREAEFAGKFHKKRDFGELHPPLWLTRKEVDDENRRWARSPEHCNGAGDLNPHIRIGTKRVLSPDERAMKDAAENPLLNRSAAERGRRMEAGAGPRARPPAGTYEQDERVFGVRDGVGPTDGSWSRATLGPNGQFGGTTRTSPGGNDDGLPRGTTPLSTKDSIGYREAGFDTLDSCYRRSFVAYHPQTYKDNSASSTGNQVSFARGGLEKYIMTDNALKLSPRNADEHELGQTIHQKHMRSSLVREAFYERAEATRAWEVAEIALSSVPPGEDERGVRA